MVRTRFVGTRRQFRRLKCCRCGKNWIVPGYYDPPGDVYICPVCWAKAREGETACSKNREKIIKK
jgi:hypothetical protein